MLNKLITINGIYDILCAISILFFPDCILANLHSDIFVSEEVEKINKRLLAYWIMTYGIVRYLSTDKMVLCFTYVIEGLVFLHEYYTYNSCKKHNAIYVSVFSLTIAYAIYIDDSEN
jgi:predicted CDP-diglyceride synthetase/phosphatidate cytidylyltransferase